VGKQGLNYEMDGSPGYDTNAVASNDPIEDDSSSAIFSRGSSTLTPGTDLLFFGIFDGHSGKDTSLLLAAELIQRVKDELDKVFHASPEYIASSLGYGLSAPAGSNADGQGGMADRFWKYLSGRMSSSPTEGGGDLGLLKDLDANPKVVELALKTAFKKLDSDIVNTPIRLLAQHELAGRKLKRGGGDGGGDGTMEKLELAVQQALKPAMSGSCALLSYIDIARNRFVWASLMCAHLG
jgi:pyruvate dehydrogenase phosphatase